MTINRLTSPQIWARFDEKNYLDFCPSVAKLPDGRQWVAFRRNRVPPVWGAGEIWMVQVDAALSPIGAPFQLIAAGEDPRLLVLGNRLFLLYVFVDRNTQGEINGTTIALAEIAIDGFNIVHHLKLPQNPLGTAKKPDNSMVGYEKNWVPFAVDASTIGILYSHAPWIVLELFVGGAPSDWRLTNAHQNNGLEWGYGEIRGGSVPIEYGPDEYISFFHSSAKTGGKKIYYGGACVFSKKAPYSPTYFTTQPLITSPFKAGSDKHGWYLGQPIIFPLGAFFNQVKNSFEILCSLDDAFICLYSLPLGYVKERLAKVERERRLPYVLNTRKKHPADPDAIVVTTKKRIQFHEELIRFVNAMEINGDVYFDAGSDDGDFLVLLGKHFGRSIAISFTQKAHESRRGNVQMNMIETVSLLTETEFASAISDIGYAGSIRPTDEVWFRLDCSDAAIDLNRYVTFALQVKASIILSGVTQDDMRNIHARFGLGNYVLSIISSLNQLVFVLIEKSHVKKYEWFI